MCYKPNNIVIITILYNHVLKQIKRRENIFMNYILYIYKYIFLKYYTYLSVLFTHIFIISVLISPYGLDLLSGIISFQPEGLPLVFLV